MKKIIPILIVLLLSSLYITKVYFFSEKENKETNQTVVFKDLGSFVKITKKTEIFESSNNKYSKIGFIEKNSNLEIESSKEDYLKIKDTDLFVQRKDLDTSSEKDEVKRYKDYIVWNENISTKNTFTLYDENDNVIFTINKKSSFPIIIKDREKFGIEFNNNLYFIKEYNSIDENENSNVETRSNIRTLTYHSVYDKEKNEICNNSQICLNKTKFIEQLDYIKENNYLTLTMEEIEMFVDKKIQIPKNSIALTFDDGLLLHNIIPLTEEYKVYATFFIITSEGDYADYFDYKYARFESHTHDMHQNYKCPRPYDWSQGGLMTCAGVENVAEDLKISQEKLNGSVYFAYPFFEFYGDAKEGLKKAGFKMAFIGQWDTDGYSTYDTDRYMMRRKTVFDTHTMDDFIKFLK